MNPLAEEIGNVNEYVLDRRAWGRRARNDYFGASDCCAFSATSEATIAS